MQSTSSNSKQTDDRERIAGVLAGLLRQTYGEKVEIVTRGWTITISRGTPAAQVQVVDGTHFLVAKRRNKTFHMHPVPVDRTKMASLVDEMVGERPGPSPV